MLSSERMTRSSPVWAPVESMTTSMPCDSSAIRLAPLSLQLGSVLSPKVVGLPAHHFQKLTVHLVDHLPQKLFRVRPQPELARVVQDFAIRDWAEAEPSRASCG